MDTFVKILTFFLVFYLIDLSGFSLGQENKYGEGGTPEKEKSSVASTRAPKIHVEFGIACTTTPAIGNIMDAYEAAGLPTDSSWNASDHITWTIGAGYSLSNHLRLGLVLTQSPDLAFHSTQEGVGASEGTAAMSYSLLIEYVPRPVIFLFMSKLEFALGAGVVYSSVSAWNSLYSYYGASPEDVFKEIKDKKLGIHLRASFDYYLHRNLSGQFKIDGKIISSIDMAAISYASPLVDKTYILPDHSINLSSIDLSLCLRFHF